MVCKLTTCQLAANLREVPTSTRGHSDLYPLLGLSAGVAKNRELKVRVTVELIIVGWVVLDQVVGKGGRATWRARQLTSSLVAFHKHLVAFHLKSAVLNLHHDGAQKALKRKRRESARVGEGWESATKPLLPPPAVPHHTNKKVRRQSLQIETKQRTKSLYRPVQLRHLLVATTNTKAS